MLRKFVKTLWSGALIIAALAATSALEAGESGLAKPRIEVASDYYYFGYMPINAIVHHDYWIRNKGTDTLQIISVKPGCGCTAAPLSKDVIAPGDSSQLKIIFDSKNMTGKMVKDVQIYSNDPNNPAITVKFFAVVNREHDFVRALPNVLRFAKFGSKDGKLTKSFDIVNNYDSEVSLKLIELPSTNFKIDKTTAKIGPGGKATFTLEQIEAVKGEDDVLTSVTFEFVGKETDRITIPLTAYLQP
jgi:hypothetical protein